MKKTIIFLSIIFTIILAIILGIYTYRVNIYNTENSKIDINNNVNVETVLSKDDNYSLFLETNSNEEKTSPNTLFILKTYFNKCGHIINEYKDAQEELVNLNEEEIKNKFINWELRKFSKEEIILSIDRNEFCDEHFIIKEENGGIVIYKVNESGEESLYDTTSISTEYLTTEDLLKIKSGIKVYGRETLNSILEDFE